MNDPGPFRSPLNEPLVTGPILPTLLRLALPNMVALTVQAAVVIAETVYIGSLGTASLAAMALVFPMIMMTQQMSSGAMGGGVSAAVARALGAGDVARARALALHATVIGLIAGLAFTLIFRSLGRSIYPLLGGRGDVLVQALAYSDTFFTGVIAIWLLNTFASIARGTGNMRVPSMVVIGSAGLQVVLGGSLGLGLGPFPKLGIAGVALGQLMAVGCGSLVLLWFLQSGRARLRLGVAGIRLNSEMFFDILKVGALACLSSLQSVATVIILARTVAVFGTDVLAGYGIGVRLEFLLVPIAFAIGTACVPMVGMAIGARDIGRARRVAWTGACLSAGIIGIIGIGVAIYPDAWAAMFTNSPGVRAATHDYLRWTGTAFPFYGLGLCLYFASQGSGKLAGPVLGASVRLLVVAIAGFVMTHNRLPPTALFALAGFSLVAYGITIACAVKLTRWGR